MRSRTGRLVVLGVSAVVLVVAATTLRSDPGPYVVTAVDNHFHDAHPTLPIGTGRDLVVKNEGRNLHNVTIEALSYSRDVPAGTRVTITKIAERLGPGRYTLICRYHHDRGMTGTIVIAG